METTRQDQYWIWLTSIEGIGAKRFHMLLGEFTDIEKVWQAACSGGDGLEIIGPKLKERLCQCANIEYLERQVKRAFMGNCRPVTMLNAEYPRLLLEIYDPPPVLFVRGGKIDYEKAVAVVGTRACTRVGKDTAMYIGEGLSRAGVTVISGLARGIDACAHAGALNCKTPTIAVLGCGPDVIYPQENRRYYDAILEQGGAIVSEYFPGTPPSQNNFPARNRIISGMSRAVVVVECPKRSGTMITVSFAQEQGRDVFAVPGNILIKNNEGTNALLRECAYPLTRVEDVLEEYGWSQTERIPMSQMNVSFGAEEKEEKILFTLLSEGEMTYDELLEASHFEPKLLNSALTMMELKGIIKQYPGKIFDLNR